MISNSLKKLNKLEGYDWVSFICILLISIFPLFFNFPYRVNIYLSWEGAYRMYMGQMPFADFGLPMGYAYWLIPSLFFKLFGPYLASLIKAQVVINLASGLAFYSVLGSFNVKSPFRTIAVIVFCISYSLFNFWPWYNHSVIVFQLIGLAFLLKGVFSDSKWNFLHGVFAGFFTFLSMFTKQDAGGMALMLALGMLAINVFYEKDWKKPVVFISSYVLFAAIFILPLLDHGFTYWFNYGQLPHNSRLVTKDFIDAIFGGSQWEKFYLFLVFIVIIGKSKNFKEYLRDRNQVLFAAFTIFILGEALLLQVTSYTPPNNNIFFHSFGFAYALSQLPLGINISNKKAFAGCLMLVLFWWSGSYWKYIDRIIKRAIPTYGQVDENKISIKTFMKHETTNNVSMEKWVFSSLPAFQNIYMPESTVKGIDRLLDLPLVKSRKKLKVLNMSELTPLAQAMPYELESGMPLWYHLGVGIFKEQVDMFCERIEDGYYDMVLFEEVPYLNNFFPKRVHETLDKHYQHTDKFLAPRRPTNASIHVYLKKDYDQVLND